MKYWDVSWNPITGCTPISEGCAHCYAKELVEHGRLAGHARYPGGFSPTEHEDRLLKIPGKKGDRVFVGNMGDLFHEAFVASGFVDMVFAAMLDQPARQYIVLTKRPERMARFFARWDHGIPDNWLVGVTAEEQGLLDGRLPALLRVPAKNRFISVEPMLGPVSIYRCGTCGTSAAGKSCCPDCLIDQTEMGKSVPLVICGGESGPNARTMNPAWARILRDECQNAGVKFHMKQMSGRKAIPEDLDIQEWI